VIPGHSGDVTARGEGPESGHFSFDIAIAAVGFGDTMANMDVPQDGAGAMSTYRSVVWAIEVWDPARILVDDDVSQRTAATVSVVAAQHGGTFLWCSDDDDADEVPYYCWYIRLPQDEHRRRTPENVPVAVDSVHRALEASLPAPFDDWAMYPDEDLSFDEELNAYFRDAYADLLDVIDARLLPLRCDGAETLDPVAKCYGDRLSDGSLVADYTIWLCRPQTSIAWLLLRVGFVPDVLPGEPVGRTWITSGRPVLLAPRPRTHLTWTWMANLRMGGFVDDVGRPGVVATRPADGSRHQWQAGQEAAHAVTDAISRTIATRMKAHPPPTALVQRPGQRYSAHARTA
jgi:hypothetical protein